MYLQQIVVALHLLIKHLYKYMDTSIHILWSLQTDSIFTMNKKEIKYKLQFHILIKKKNDVLIKICIICNAVLILLHCLFLVTYLFTYQKHDMIKHQGKLEAHSILLAIYKHHSHLCSGSCIFLVFKESRLLAVIYVPFAIT